MKSSQFINFDTDVLRRFILFQQQQPKVDRKAVISIMTSRSFTPSNMTPPPISSHSQLFFFYLSQYELEEMFIEKVKNVSRLQILPFSRQINVCKT